MCTKNITTVHTPITHSTPCTGAIYDGLPPESRIARARMLLPILPPSTPIDFVVHLAGTGDHGFDRRLSLGIPLLQHGIASVALESPYYGKRRPAGQWGSKLAHVSDLLALGRATIEESLLLLHWAQIQGMERLGMLWVGDSVWAWGVHVLLVHTDAMYSHPKSCKHTPTPPPQNKGVSGFSMGGVHAAMVASLYPGDLACAPLLAPRSAATAYCRGALRHATAWQPLVTQHDKRQRHVQHAVQGAISAMAAIQRGALLRQQRAGGGGREFDESTLSPAVSSSDIGHQTSPPSAGMLPHDGSLPPPSRDVTSGNHLCVDFQQASAINMFDDHHVVDQPPTVSRAPNTPSWDDAPATAHTPPTTNPAYNAAVTHDARMHALDQAHASWRQQQGTLPLPGGEDVLQQQQAAVLEHSPEGGHPEAWYWLEQVLEAYTDVTRYPRCVFVFWVGVL